MNTDVEYQKLMGMPSSSDMDEIPKLRAVPSFKQFTEEEMSREGSETEADGLPRYMSLKDVMTNVSPRGGCGTDIAIRNELVKHAASAYVLSATIITSANRDQDSSFKMCCVGFLSCCKIHVGLPFLDFFYHILRRIRSVC